jgi:hypothetical protein
MHLFFSIIPPNSIPIFQASILNYEKNLKDWFGRSLSERLPHGMLFLVSEIDPSQFTLSSPLLVKHLTPETIDALSRWQNRVKETVDDLKESEIGQFAIPISINIASVKNPKKADIIAELQKYQGGESDNSVIIAERRINELDYYTHGLKEIAAKLELTPPKTTAFVRYLKLQNDNECFKQIKIGNSKFPRYSQKAVERIKYAMKKITPEQVWETHGHKTWNKVK